jgi:hypothetical protein
VSSSELFTRVMLMLARAVRHAMFNRARQAALEHGRIRLTARTHATAATASQRLDTLIRILVWPIGLRAVLYESP